MLIILFGYPGVGKTHIGKLLQQHYGYHFYDADVDLTPAALQAIEREEVFSRDIENEFVDVVIDRVKQLQQQHEHLIVAQAFGREAPRQKLLTQVKDASFFWIAIPTELANHRLKQRNDWVNIAYADKIRQAFEELQIPHHIIDNSQDDAYVLAQFSDKLLER